MSITDRFLLVIGLSLCQEDMCSLRAGHLKSLQDLPREDLPAPGKIFLLCFKAVHRPAEFLTQEDIVTNMAEPCIKAVISFYFTYEAHFVKKLIGDIFYRIKDKLGFCGDNNGVYW